MTETDKDNDIEKTINETIKKVNSESFNKLSYLKLQELNNNL